MRSSTSYVRTQLESGSSSTDLLTPLFCVCVRVCCPSIRHIQDNDQRITRTDLVRAMTGMGYSASEETADNILREVDFGRKGAIEFKDYLDVGVPSPCLSILLSL